MMLVNMATLDEMKLHCFAMIGAIALIGILCWMAVMFFTWAARNGTGQMGSLKLIALLIFCILIIVIGVINIIALVVYAFNRIIAMYYLYPSTFQIM